MGGRASNVSTAPSRRRAVITVPSQRPLLGVLNGRLVIEKIPPEEQQVLLQFQAERRVEVVTTRFPLYKIAFPAAA